MNKAFKTIAALACIALASFSCQKIEESNDIQTSKVVNFTASALETRTVFGTPEGTKYPTLWTANDTKVKVSLNYASPKDAELTPSADGKTASFSVDVKDDETGSYTFYSLSPSSAALGISGGDYKSWSVEIPASQKPTENSVAENAQILVAQSEVVTEFPSSVKLNYKHLTAYGRMSLKNLELADATITSIALTASKNWVGRWYYYNESGQVAENSASATITLETNATDNLWFACAPVDLSGETLKVTVNTTNGPLVKEITLPDNTKFESGVINKFAVDMDGIGFEESKVYSLVTDLSELTENSVVIIAAAEFDYAISTTQNNNNRGQASVTKSDDSKTVTDPGENVQVFTLEKGKADNSIAFNTGNGYIYAAGGGNYLRTDTGLNAKGSFLVELTSEGTVLEASDNSVSQKYMRYNGSSSMFSCYAANSTVKDLVNIYKLKGSGNADKPLIVVDNTEYTITVANVENGTVEASATAAKKGTEITLTITPAEGYLSDALTVKDAEGNDVEVKDNKFTMPASDVIVSATFKEKEEGVVEFIFGSNISATSGTIDGVTLTTVKNSGSNAPAYNANYSQLRLYRYNSMTLASESNIKSIVITYDGTNIGSDTAADTGSYSCENSVGTWSGSSKAVTITNTGTENVQMRITKIVVTLE
ncbi:MAG: hypothetical protein J6N80_06295 [Bacteroidales bacterium]|nr:hypothetical protein [Bacteroidales bacterium]